MDRLIVCPKANDDSGKSRAFSVRLIGYIIANRLWELGSGASDTCLRPVWLAFTGTTQECRAFQANVRTGRKIRRMKETDRWGKEQLEIPRSARFRFLQAPGPGDTAVVTAYLPRLFDLDPPSTEEPRIDFIAAPSTAWVRSQVPAARELLGDDLPDEEAIEVATSAVTTAYLDRRTGLPLVKDIGFHRQLVAAALEEKLLTPLTNIVYGSKVGIFPGQQIPGLERPTLCRASHGQIEELIKTQTALYFEEDIERGKIREPSPGRILPHPGPASQQLSLWD